MERVEIMVGLWPRDAFGGADLPRLRVLPTILFTLLTVIAFAAALPAPLTEGDLLIVPLSAWPMAMIAAPGLAAAAFILLFSHPGAFLSAIPLTAVFSFLISRDLPTAIFSLLWFIPALGLARLIAGGVHRASAVCQLSLLCGMVCLPSLYLTIGRSWGTFRPGEMIHLAADAMIDLFSSIRVPDADGTLIAYGAAQSAEIAELMLMLLPGLVVLLCNLTAWAANGLLLWLFRLHRLDALLPAAVRELRLSRVAAVLFLIACLLSLLYGVNEPLTVPEAVGLNLLLILEPAFAAVGFSSLFSALRERGNLLRFVICAFAALFFCGGSVFLLLVALFGTYKTFRRSARL